MAKMREEILAEAENKIKSTEEKYTQKEQEQQIQQFKYQIKDLISSEKDTYEFINAEENGIDLVYDVIYTDLMNQKKAMEEEGAEGELKMMDIKDAAEKVESYLDKSYQKYLNLNKVKSKFSSDDKIGNFIAQSQPKTLNNSFSPKSQSVDQLNPTERRLEAERLVKSWMAKN